ncbi:class I SAM-dependent methyltransferase [Cohnella soli]|uniref:Class I SAM-dependent methyltransferase n=1 Tax=Cohnella soli TaxID=425005 RepID=A0ABW0HWN9_9BACL
MSAIYPIYINYPIVPKPRFGGVLPRHEALYELINAGRRQYEQHLTAWSADHADKLASIAWEQDHFLPGEPAWDNPWFSSLDAISLYGIVATSKPKRYFEIGSGFSTKFARRAATDAGYGLEVVSVDPLPRDEIDELCDRVVRQPLENADLRLFDELEAGDILFVDSSHYVFQNSDANIVFLEVMPKLRAGVLVHFHDIFLPEDYPASWSARFYNEQYMLAATLLGQQSAYEIVFPAYFISQDVALAQLAQPLVDRIGSKAAQSLQPSGGSFWIRKK